jgi:hypothetical protein
MFSLSSNFLSKSKVINELSLIVKNKLFLFIYFLIEIIDKESNYH